VSALPEVWELDIEAPDWLEAIIRRLLAVGVPPTAIAKAFNLSPDPVKELVTDLRIEKYGTAELGELMYSLMLWAYEDVLRLIEQSPPARRLQLDMALLSKMSVLVGGQTPDSFAKMHSEFGKMMTEVRGIGEVTPPTGTIYGEPDPIDAPIDDPEEGSVS
jgi:hypothetical protein